MMALTRTVELGRAVIALPSANIELWLTTLITLSPDTTYSTAQHSNFDLQTLESNVLLDHLSSGDVWVRRGNAMHMSLDCRKLGKPLDSHDLRQLGDSIINAPAWKQFGLCLALPLNHQPSRGKLHVNIDRCREGEQSLTNISNTITSSFNADVRPPEGIPMFSLETIQFVIALCETRNRVIVRKHAKRKTAKPASDIGGVKAFLGNAITSPESSYRSEPILCSSYDANNDVVLDGDFHIQASIRAQRSLTALDSKTNPGFSNRGKRKRPVTFSGLPAIQVADRISPESVHITMLIDAVLRFSIYLNLRGSTYNLKVKTNTFIHGLADIAPALWRIGYLSTCSRAMYTTPTLARSLIHVQSSTRSAVLKAKIAALTNSPSKKGLEQGSAGRNIVHDVTTTITNRLWCHIQRTQLAKAISSPIQALCDPGFQHSPTEDSIEILEEYRGLGTTNRQGEDDGLEEVAFSSNQLDNTTHNRLYRNDQFCAQSQMKTPPSINTIAQQTSQSHGQNHACSASGSVSSTFTGSSIQMLDDKVAEEKGPQFGCKEPAMYRMLDDDRLAREDASADIAWVSELALPPTDNEDVLFSF